MNQGWIWPSWLASGMLHLIVGMPGEGKSIATMDMAARVSTGRPFPDGSPGCAPGGVVILNAEDGLRNVIIPRLMAAEADLARIKILEATRDGDATREIDLSRDMATLEEAITVTKAKLVVIDPISAYFGATNTWNDGQVRGILTQVKAIAERTGSAVVAIIHPNKSQGLHAIQRVSSSIAFAAAARVIMSVVIDPENPDNRALGQIKNNPVQMPAPRGFSFIPVTIPNPGGKPIQTAMLAWSKEAVKVDVKSALEGQPKNRGALGEAKELIRELLGADKAIRGSDVITEGESRDVSEKSLERARKDMGLGSFKIGREWIWAKTRQDAKAYVASRPVDMASLSPLSPSSSSQEDKNILLDDQDDQDVIPTIDGADNPSPSAPSSAPDDDGWTTV